MMAITPSNIICFVSISFVLMAFNLFAIGINMIDVSNRPYNVVNKASDIPDTMLFISVTFLRTCVTPSTVPAIPNIGAYEPIVRTMLFNAV